MSANHPSPYLRVKRIIEFVITLLLYAVLRLLPFSVSSALLGKIVRLLGRFHSSHQTALKNLHFAFPEKSEREINDIALASWENLGRVAGELPHISLYSDDKIKELCPISEIENVEAADKYAKEKNTGFILISAHIGNWELASRMLLVLNKNTALVYRKANNPHVEKLIQKMRHGYTSFIIQKGDKTGMRDIVKHLKAGGRLGMLADQKMNDGITLKFFGTEVKAPATAGELAAKYDMPIVMGRVVRDEKTKVNFVLKFDKLIMPDGKTGYEINQEIYDNYERWIREYPKQWFWQHNRFNINR